MSELAQRRLTLEVGDLRIQAATGALSLRVRFDISRDEKPYPNNASISIYNLNENSREALASTKDISVRLEAGYAENVQQIFFGTLRRGRTTREPPDWITTLEAGDGEKELQVATIVKSFAVGTPVGTILKELVSAIGLGTGNITQFLATAKLSSGNLLAAPLTIAGPVVEELQEFTRSIGLSYSIQDGAIQLLDVTRPVLPGTAVLLNAASGLIGQPRIDVDRDTNKDLCVARSLLQPRLVPGALFRVESALVNGSFSVRKSRHFGDTHANDWYVDVEGLAIG